MIFAAGIPARYNSKRFKGKPLAKINQKPMIYWVAKTAIESKLFKRVFVATDNIKIYECVKDYGFEAVMTSSKLKSGTDRIYYGAQKLNLKYDWIMNIQGDEPLIKKMLLKSLIQRARIISSQAIITAVSNIKDKNELNDRNIVKTVINKQNKALYFSRQPVPDNSRNLKNKFLHLKHIGVYLFHKKALQTFVNLGPSILEKAEKLEQLRAYECNIPIYTVKTAYSPVNVDIPSDIKKVESIIKKRKK